MTLVAGRRWKGDAVPGRPASQRACEGQGLSDTHQLGRLYEGRPGGHENRAV